MKKTLTINLGGIVFNIDNDAFEVLNKYLTDISILFSSDEDKDDIMQDIEARIGELFSERFEGDKNVVTIQDVNDIIGIMGMPSQFSDSEAKSDNNPKKKKRGVKRFFSDPENSIFGGIASGLSYYLGINVVVIRIILVFLIIITGGMIVPFYILAWLVTPEAKTSSERLEMQGEEVNVQTIKSEFDNTKNSIQNNETKNPKRNSGKKLENFFRKFFRVIIVFIATILGLVGILLIFAVGFSVFMSIFHPEMNNYLIYSPVFTLETSVFAAITLLLVIGCPIFILMYWAIRAVSKNKSKSKTTYWVAFGLWLIGLCMFIGLLISTIAVEVKQRNLSISEIQWNKNYELHKTEPVNSFFSIIPEDDEVILVNE